MVKVTAGKDPRTGWIHYFRNYWCTVISPKLCHLCICTWRHTD